MMKTKVFKSGNSQAVRIPKKFAFTSMNVEILKRDDEVILREASENLREKLSNYRLNFLTIVSMKKEKVRNRKKEEK